MFTSMDFAAGYKPRLLQHVIRKCDFHSYGVMNNDILRNTTTTKSCRVARAGAYLIMFVLACIFWRRRQQ